MTRALIVNDTSLALHHGCNLLMNTIKHNFFLNKIIISGSIFNEEQIKFSKINKKKIKKSDIILINGEGTIHRNIDNDNQKVNEIINFINILKKKFKKKIFIFNASFSNLTKKDLRTLKKVDAIFVREKFSYVHLKKNNINSYIIPDFVLLSKKLYNNNYNYNNNNNIIVTDSSIKKNNLTMKLFAIDRNFIFLPMLYNFGILRYIKYLLKFFYIKFNLEFFLFIIYKLKNKKDNEYFNKIINAKFVITGRFHCICFCIRNKIPFYALKGNTHKVNGLLKLAGLEDRLVDYDDLHKLKKFNCFTQTEEKKIDKFLLYSKNKFKFFFKKIKN
jgi:polysaccharide pyruvyl transferase WcaK-like protein